MVSKHFWIIVLAITAYSNQINADRFSQYAEARNVLDHRQLHWAIRPSPVKLEFYGYVKNEGIYDSRQNFVLRDGHFLYFPLDKMPDVTGADINSRGDFDMYAIQTRWGIRGEGPEICNFKSGFIIEAEFFGRTDPTIDECDLRFAYLTLETENLQILAGQDLHPICFPFESPDTISYNSGVPMAPLAFCPQFRVTYQKDNVVFQAASIGFLGDRPFGLAGGTDKVFRDAMMPDFYIQMRLLQDEYTYCGIGFDVNRIVPRLVTLLNYKEISPVTSISTDFFSRLQYNDLVIYTKLMYSQTAAIFELIGGIAVHTFDPLTDKRTYTPLQTLAFYAEFIRQGAFEPGLFIGVAKSLGAVQTIIPSLESQETVYGIGTNIDTVFRISPRIRWYIKSFIVGIEYEYTRAAYGIINTHGKIEDAIPVANNRFLFATYYVF